MGAVVASDVSAAVTAGCRTLQLLASTGSRRQEVAGEPLLRILAPTPAHLIGLGRGAGLVNKGLFLADTGVTLWRLLKMKMAEFLGRTFICMENAIRSTKNTSKNIFDQSIPFGVALRPPRNKNHGRVLFDSSNEAFGCTGYNAKKSTYLDGLFLRKLDLTIKKRQKKWTLIFFKTV